MTKKKRDSVVMWLGVAALGLALAACGGGEVTGSAVTGVAQTDGPISGTVSLADSSAVAQRRTVSTRPDGSFSIDVADLTPPYMLRVEWTDDAGSGRMFAVTEGNENLDVNAITDLAFSSAASSSGEDEDEVFEHSESEEKRESSTRARALLVKLSKVLAPLFERYGITDPWKDKVAVRALLKDVRLARDDGRVKVTNRATGGVIFEGRLSNLEAGTFHPENMPAGPGAPPASTCTAFTYSPYGACQPNNTQARTVLTSSPTGCTGGAPVTTQACTYVPPGPTTCTAFTYSAYGACQPNNTQTRTVLTSSPAGCTGGSPVTTQACTYVPPVVTCTSFTYSAYGSCQPNNTQTRTVLSSSPAGCTGGSPVTTQACTYVPPVVTCTSFTYSAYGACQPSNTQTRTVLSSSPAGCTGGSPVTTQACTYVPPIDGAALYTQYCAGCHGNSKKGASASSTQAAINSNRGGMGTAALRALTPAQIAAIAAAP